jgi:hypothetical protein
MKTSPYQQLYAYAGMSLLDVVNLAKCAADRARGSAGEPGQRFMREYKSALLWSSVAATYNLTNTY